MEICNNKKTGQTFIHLDEQDNDQALMITPQGAVKALEYGLFTEPAEVDEEEVLAQGVINRKQYDIYSQYYRN
jgi:hypothetical protein